MDKFVLGAAWRWDAAVSAMAGFQVSDGLYIGYGYDMETTELKNYNGKIITSLDHWDRSILIWNKYTQRLETIYTP